MKISINKWGRYYEHRDIKNYRIEASRIYDGISIKFIGVSEKGKEVKSKGKMTTYIEYLGSIILPEKVALSLVFKILENLYDKSTVSIHIKEN